MSCNADILAQARANVAEYQTPANGRAIARGEWDGGILVQAEIARLLREPVISGGEE
jgi:hypothetical protein